ncbi:MAG: HlyD family efflux transporter periplasmic adaptor subunit [Planctomycetota bacterium]
MSSTDALLDEPASAFPPEHEEHSPVDSVQANTDDAVNPTATTVSEPSKPGTWSRRSVGLAIAASGIAIIGSIALMTSKPSGSGAAAEPTDVAGAIPVSIIRAGTMTAPDLTRSYSGVLLARQESLLSFERGGRVLTLSKQEGDVVLAGEHLAELDQENLDAAELRTQSELAAAEARLAELVAGPRQQTLDAAKARVEQLTAEVGLAKVDADRQQRLIVTNATSRAAYDAAVFGLRAKENALAAQRATLDELVEGTRKEQIAIQKANVAGMQAALKEIQAQRRDSRIEAPFDGKIQSRVVDEGVVVSTGAAAFQLVSHAIEARFGLPPSVATQFKVGAIVTIRLHGQTRQGWVDRVEPTIDRSTRTRGVFIRFGESSGDEPELFERLAESGWVAGELPELLINESDASQAQDKFWLPTKSLKRGARGLWMVLVVPGDAPAVVCERRAVELLKTDGDRALVQGMIARGERIIDAGLHRVTAGLLVAPTE